MSLSAYKKHRLFNLLKVIFVSVSSLAIILLLFQVFVCFFSNETVISKECSRGENVALIKVHGDIVTYGEIGLNNSYIASSEKVVKYIEEADKDSGIKAIIIDIDSFGGSPVAGEEIADALKKAKKPTIALIRGNGDSAAYMAATGARKIYASVFSEVGNIGVTMSYLDYSQQNINEGIIYQDLSSGQFKDIGNPEKELTDEEKTLLLDFVDQLKEEFVNLVSENRNISKSKVQEMADGSIMTASEAKTRGLVDEIGGLDEIKNYLKKELKIKADICSIE